MGARGPRLRARRARKPRPLRALDRLSSAPSNEGFHRDRPARPWDKSASVGFRVKDTAKRTKLVAVRVAKRLRVNEPSMARRLQPRGAPALTPLPPHPESTHGRHLRLSAGYQAGRSRPGSVPGLHAVRLIEWAREAGPGGLIHVAGEERRAEQLAQALKGLAPDLEVLLLPPWDCLPYDSASPSREAMGRRASRPAPHGGGERGSPPADRERRRHRPAGFRRGRPGGRPPSPSRPARPSRRRTWRPICTGRAMFWTIG
jgi:hypothetical protein